MSVLNSFFVESFTSEQGRHHRSADGRKRRRKRACCLHVHSAKITLPDQRPLRQRRQHNVLEKVEGREVREKKQKLNTDRILVTFVY